jgi:7-cyano-7-deazaguanine reductase
LEAMLEIYQRRNLIQTEPNPGTRIDYVVTLQSNLTGAKDVFPARLTLRYVPDRLILKTSNLAEYYAEIASIEFENFEAAAVLLMDDFNNELVPRWISLRLDKQTADNDQVFHHETALEDRQPKWGNPRLLDRLERY